MGPQNPQRLADQTADRLLHMIGNDPAYGPGVFGSSSFSLATVPLL